MTKDDTLFVAGYEQAKRDFLEKLYAEVGIPDTKEHTKDPERVLEISSAEKAARNTQNAQVSWWRRL